VRYNAGGEEGWCWLVPPKTPRSRRTIYLSEFAQSALTGQRQRQDDRRRTPKRWTDSGLVFTNRTGEGLEQGVVEGALIQALANAARICSATATIKLILDTYSHFTQPLHERAGRTMHDGAPPGTGNLR